MNVRITPLYSGPSWGTLITINDTINILIDCGWSTAFNRVQVTKLIRHLPHVDLILLSHSTFSHLGALPYLYQQWCKQCKEGDESGDSWNHHSDQEAAEDKWTIPIVCTDPVCRLGRITVFDALESRRLHRPFDLFDVEDVDKVFSKCKCLRYSQHHGLRLKNIDIIVCPHAAGHSLGGSMWSIKVFGREILFGVSYDATPQWLLEGCKFDGFSRPSLFITDLYDKPIGWTQWKTPALRNILRGVCKVLKQGGSVLIPVDVNAVFFELLVHFEVYWSSHANVMSIFPVSFLSPVADSVILGAKTMIEWMQKRIRSKFNNLRFNPFNSFEYVTLLHGIQELERYNSQPKVIFATPGSLDIGFSRALFEEMAVYQKNLVLFPVAPVPQTFAYELWKQQHSKLEELGKNSLVLNFEKYFKSELHADELYQLYLNLKAKQTKVVADEMENKNVNTETIIDTDEAVDNFMADEQRDSTVTGNIRDTTVVLSVKHEHHESSQNNDVSMMDGAFSQDAFRLPRLGYAVPSFHSLQKNENAGSLNGDESTQMGRADFHNSTAQTDRKHIASISVEELDYGKGLDEHEKSMWNSYFEEDETILATSSSVSEHKRRRFASAGQQKPANEYHEGEYKYHMQPPVNNLSQKYNEMLSLGASYKQRAKLGKPGAIKSTSYSSGEAQAAMFAELSQSDQAAWRYDESEQEGEEEEMGDDNDDEELQDGDVPDGDESDEDSETELPSEQSKEDGVAIPSWRRQLRKMLITEPFQYNSEIIPLTVRCDVHVCFGLEGLTCETILRQKLLEMAPRRVCFLPSSSAYCCGLISSYLKNSCTSIKEVHSPWRYKKHPSSIGQNSSYHTAVSKPLAAQPTVNDHSLTSERSEGANFDLVESIRIDIPCAEVIAEVDERLWKEFLWSSLRIPENDENSGNLKNHMCVAASLSAIACLKESSEKAISLPNKENLSNAAVKPDSTNGSNEVALKSFWAPTVRVPQLRLEVKKPAFASKDYQSNQTEVSNVPLESPFAVDEAKQDNERIHMRDQFEDSEMLLIGDLAMRNAASKLIEEFPQQVSYAPQGGILTIANRVAVRKQSMKDRTFWKIEGTIDPSYYAVRKCISKQFAKLQRSG